ncbi:hypothetical protein SCHPADRAFT_792177, partial [Schizopora paradoxa]
MANYLPVLLVSVSAGLMPDDASLQPLPRGQVDYLSHDWAQEEDVWRSWRSMTKNKNEIANGVRLENASWRTWWKQRNNLSTVSPETLNWFVLKDSDVTWLYGPLHTAVEWTPPPAYGPGYSYGHIPSSTSTTPGSANGSNAGMKPILKHRSISEMLTGALPAMLDGSSSSSYFPPSSAGPDSVMRPKMQHTRSDTNILRRLAHRERQLRPPRVAVAASQYDQHDPLPYVHSPSRTPSTTPPPRSFASPSPSSSSASSATPLTPSSRIMPQKKHISFNAIVEQCISIDSESDSPS